MYSFYPIVIKTNEEAETITIEFPGFKGLLLTWPAGNDDDTHIHAGQLLRMRISTMLLDSKEVPLPTVLEGENDEAHHEVIYFDVKDHMRLMALNKLAAMRERLRARAMADLADRLIADELIEESQMDKLIDRVCDLTQPFKDFDLLLAVCEHFGASLEPIEVVSQWTQMP